MVEDFEKLLGKRGRSAIAAALKGDYELLLGAGASLGATNRNGALPNSKQLVSLLGSRYKSAPISPEDSLSRAYQRALMSTTEANVWAFMSEIFSLAHHDAWFRDLAGLPWHRVWTLNVDDTYENAYGASRRAQATPARTISWDDPYSQTDHVEIVHLHGHVIGKDARRLVFSFAEYRSAAQIRPVWSQMLAGVLGTKPVVTIGAKVLDDPDIESLFMGNKPQSSAPSIVVDPYISDGNAWELEQLGYLVVRMTGADFVREWIRFTGLDASGLDALYSASLVELPQFTRLQTNHVPPSPRGHDFLGGDEPVWADICANRAALFEWIRKIVEDIEDWVGRPARSSQLRIIYSPRLVGATTGLFTIAKEARGRSVEVLLFDKSSRFNTQRLVAYCRSRGPILLLVDGGRDFGDDIDRLLRAAADDADVSLYVVVTALPTDYLRLEGRLLGSYSKEASQVRRRLTRTDASSVVAKLETFGRLGSLELKSGGERLSHFRDRELFSAMMEAEYAVGFRHRLELEVSALRLDWQKDLVLLLALANQGTRDVGLIDASFAIGVSADRIQAGVETDEALAALVELNVDRLIARQRASAVSIVVESRGQKRSIAVLKSILTGLSPLATRQGLRERNRAAVLVGYLMNAGALHTTFPAEDLEAFYEDMRPLFGDWNGRYWEQRAIHAKSVKDWAHAESYAGRAVSLYDDAFTRTTYGTILINRAEDLANRNDDTWITFFERGKGELALAENHEPGNRITAFAFLNATLPLLRAILEGTDESQPLRAEYATVVDDWSDTYASLRTSISDESGFESIAPAEKLSERFAETLKAAGRT